MEQAMRKRTMEELERKTVEAFQQAAKMPVIAILENVRSAYNVGSVLRTADAFLLEAVYLCGYTAHPPHKEIRKTALGAEETVQWRHFKTTAEALQAARNEGFSPYAIEQAHGSTALQNFQSTKKIAVVLGNEVTGVEQQTIAQCDGCIEIPQWGMKHSLNIAVAAGVVLWHLVQQRIK